MNPLERAEQNVIRAAMRCLDKDGWLFKAGGQIWDEDAVRRLEAALQRLRDARRAAKKQLSPAPTRKSHETCVST